MSSIDFQNTVFSYHRCADHDAPKVLRYPVVVVGAGPVGLSLAIDLAQQGVAVVLLDNDDRLSTGSRAICFAKRTLEVFDRLGCGDRMVDRGVSWSVGKVFFQDEMVYRFDLLPEAGHERPAFINLQQYYVEGFLVERAQELPLIDLRWKSAVTGLVQHADHAQLTVETPEGSYVLEAMYVVACDGSRSPMRLLCGEESHGQTFRDRFLIADVKMKADFPAERWFWFDPPFHRNQSVLLHKQPDDVWRIDFQLGWDADPDLEKRPENILPRVRALLAHTAMKDAEFELEWASVYTFSCLRMDSFRNGRVFFAGDSAHGVSPFGARGANSGIQDAENLAWKLAYVLHGKASPEVLGSYDTERVQAADENILNSTRATDFITPKSDISRLFRDSTLLLARDHAFARRLVNSGRLSVPCTVDASELNTPDREIFESAIRPGAAAADAPVKAQGKPTWLMRQLISGAFTLLVFDGPNAATLIRETEAVPEGLAPPSILLIGDRSLSGARTISDVEGFLARRFDGRPDTAYLLRPDQHVCARWRSPDADAIHAAMFKAVGCAH
ncbi:FAD-dependent oxidoreductase [Variovorax ureilyticus]|uniref:FAD-dependent oxidoreductase n=1 Tax=Variovorax ureilyticus TaxID=1836198 RepID=A0ABU8VM28_9BURK